MKTLPSQHQELLATERTPVQRGLAFIIAAQWWIVFSIVILFALFYYFRPLPGTEQAEQRLALLNQEKAKLNADKERVARRIAWVKDGSTAFLEIMARDVLEWQREGEVIVRMPQPSKK